MRVFMFSAHRDTAGQQAALRAALAVHRPRWQVDQMRRWPSPYEYPAQRGWDITLARRLWRVADVVHLDQTVFLASKMGPAAHTVVHHHGSEYRTQRERLDATEQGKTRVVSTLDLMGSPGVEWLPVVADLDGLAAMREHRASATVRIATSPSDPERKSTDRIVAAVDRLRGMGMPVELDVITGVAWAECLARKARADVFVDQLDLGYGLSAVEAWGMGLPVVAGVTDPAVRDRMLATFGSLPFADCPGGDGLTETLAMLAADRRAREDLGAAGRAHAERFHSQAEVVERLDAVYARAMAQAAA